MAEDDPTTCSYTLKTHENKVDILKCRYDLLWDMYIQQVMTIDSNYILTRQIISENSNINASD